MLDVEMRRESSAPSAARERHFNPGGRHAAGEVRRQSLPTRRLSVKRPRDFRVTK